MKTSESRRKPRFNLFSRKIGAMSSPLIAESVYMRRKTFDQRYSNKKFEQYIRYHHCQSTQSNQHFQLQNSIRICIFSILILMINARTHRRNVIHCYFHVWHRCWLLLLLMQIIAIHLADCNFLADAVPSGWHGSLLLTEHHKCCLLNLHRKSHGPTPDNKSICIFLISLLMWMV